MTYSSTPVPRAVPSLRGGPGARRGSGLGAAFGIVVVALLVAAAGGAAAGLGNPMLLVPFLLVPAALGALLLPAHWWVWALVTLAMVVVGPAIYFGRIESARLVVPALGLALLLPLALRAFAHAEKPALRTPAFMWWLGLFFVSFAFSTAISEPRLGDLVNMVRQYLWFLPLVLLLMLGALKPDSFARMWIALIVIAALQLPLALLQNFTFAAGRSGITALDAVVGSFPGNPEGGGASGGMSIFVLSMLVFAVALWKRELLKTRYLLLAGASVLGTIALAEVKAAVLLLPFAVGMIYLPELRRRPWTLVLTLLAGLAAVVVLLGFYDTQYDERTASSFRVGGGPSSSLEAVQNQLDPEREAGAYTSRMARHADWFRLNPGRFEVVHSLFGHGGGATQISRFAVGKLVPQFPYRLNMTASGVLLWESGLVGHVLLLIALLAAAWSARQSSRGAGIAPLHCALLHGAMVALVLHAITLPYSSFIFTTQPSQVLLALLLGYTAYWARQVPRQRRHRYARSSGA